MNHATCCIIIPIYRIIPTNNDLLSINRVFSVLGQYDIYFVHPDNMDLFAYKQLYYCNYISFKAKYFKSNKSYSRLLLSQKFYQSFLKYNYMLIAQTDSLILNTTYSLQEFIEKGYDYWGAPWPNGPFHKPYTTKDLIKLLFIHHPEQCKVGNGGFSLRKVNATYELVRKNFFFIKLLWHFNEDMYFSSRALSDNFYRAAPIDEAELFSAETSMQDLLFNKKIPYAVHAWEKYYTYDELATFFKP